MVSSRELLGACEIQCALVAALIRRGADPDRIVAEKISLFKLYKDYQEAELTERYIAEANA